MLRTGRMTTASSGSGFIGPLAPSAGDGEAAARGALPSAASGTGCDGAVSCRFMSVPNGRPWEDERSGRWFIFRPWPGARRARRGRVPRTRRAPRTARRCGARRRRRGSSRRVTRWRPRVNGCARLPRTRSTPGASVTSTRSAGTPGIATTTRDSSSSSAMSTGGAHAGSACAVVARWKNCACRRSARASRSNARPHITSAGASGGMAFDPLQQLRERKGAGGPRHLASTAEGDHRRDAADGEALGQRGFRLGVELREADLAAESLRRLL